MHCLSFLRPALLLLGQLLLFPALAFAQEGCTDPLACNFDPEATEDDGSCMYPGDPDCTGEDYGEWAGQNLSSDLPIIVIDTFGDDIPDEPKIHSSMGIIYNGEGELNQIGMPFSYHFGNIGIERRGNSTQGFDKCSYSVETWDGNLMDTDVDFFGMGAEEDWILHAMHIDKTQIRFPFTFRLFQQMGHYASDWQFVELVINGDYRGLYLLCERIKRDGDRLDIAKLQPAEVTGDDVTGGYILKIDWLWDFEGFESEFEAQAGNPMTYQYYYPNVEDLQPEQEAYIQDYISRFETAVFSDDYTNPEGERYTDLINPTTFTDVLIINELSKNSDGYKLSSFLHKDKDSNGGKLSAGPIWDFDQSYGSSLVCSCHDPEGWTYLQNQDCEDLESMPLWWQRMMQDEVFTNHLKCRWEAFRAGILSDAGMFEAIESDTASISAPVARNFIRWDEVIGESIWIEPNPIPQTYQAEVEAMQNWLTQRVAWLDTNMPGNCSEDVIVDLEEQAPLPEVNVYPNPARDALYVSAEHQVRLRVHSIQGQLLVPWTGNAFGHAIPLSTWSPGIYMIEVDGEAGRQVKRFMKE